MKKHLVIWLLCSLFLFFQTTSAQVHVRGYYRSNGTYVQPHERTRPNSTITDNYSYPGNYNPNTDKVTGASQIDNLNSTPSVSSSTQDRTSNNIGSDDSPLRAVSERHIPKAEEIRLRFKDIINQKLLSEAVLRKSPEIGASEIIRIPKTVSVQLLGRESEFYKATYRGKVGYIHFLYVDGDYKAFASRSFVDAVIVEPGIHIPDIETTDVYGKIDVEAPLKETPDYTSKTISNIPQGSIIKISKYNSTYWDTEINGRHGFIGNAYISSTGKTPESVITPIGSTINYSLTSPGQETTTLTHPHKSLGKRPVSKTVFICESRSAYAYHNYECHGLNRCRSSISRVSLSDAKSMGYVPCKVCY